MSVAVRSFAKINLGLCIGAPRSDGFHELHTVYQTIALHDVIRVQVIRGTGIDIRCHDTRVPKNETNTCYRIMELARSRLRFRGRVVIEIEKRLPVQGGLGGASGNAAAALLALESEIHQSLPTATKLEIAAGVGSDVPLFLVGGTVLGVGRGQEVYPLSDFPRIPCVVALPKIQISTPKAFINWDDSQSKLTLTAASDRITGFSGMLVQWLSGSSGAGIEAGRIPSGVPVKRGRGRAETLFLDLVRTGIENDFQQVVFPKYPELRKVKSELEKAGALYASLSGSGSAIYGLFGSHQTAKAAAVRLQDRGIDAVFTTTLTRQQYWKRFFRV
ncbi:MAG: 4-(cytidine 5'-diphospho)-2-C-methyl-D-erythritol kinase [Acidobacteriales bacterium]|nr:4-(cytidine 5'-diphospho)-2-C-methyl-D-erythritol kinase [Terriglobales bacterium]